MYTFLEITIPAFLTLIGYLWIPALFIIIGKKFSKRTLIIIAVTNTVIMYLIFNFTCYILYDYYSANLTPALLWGYIGYYLMKRRILKEAPPNLLDSSDVIYPKPNTLSPEPTSVSAPSKQKKNSFPLSIVVLLNCLACFGCVSYILFQQGTIIQLSENISTLQEKVSSSEEQLSELHESLDLFESNLIQIDPESRVYHKLSSKHTVKDSSYLGLLRDAYASGYSPCSNCYYGYLDNNFRKEFEQRYGINTLK